MPNLAPVVINDGTADQTFTPEGAVNGVFTFVKVPSSGIYAHRSILTVSVTNQSDHRKVIIKLQIPQLVTNADTGVTTVEGYDEFKHEFRPMLESDSAGRTELAQLGRSLLDPANTVVSPVLIAMENYY